MKEWFKNMPGIIPNEDTMIMEDPLEGKPAIVTSQQFYGTKIRDIFADINKDELTKLLAKNEKLKQDIFNFIKITKEKKEETGLMVDLLGDKNLALIDLNGEEQLIILDPHLISHPHREEPGIQEKQEQYLQDLCQKVGYKDEQQDEDSTV